MVPQKADGTVCGDTGSVLSFDAGAKAIEHRAGNGQRDRVEVSGRRSHRLCKIEDDDAAGLELETAVPAFTRKIVAAQAEFDGVVVDTAVLNQTAGAVPRLRHAVRRQSGQDHRSEIEGLDARSKCRWIGNIFNLVKRGRGITPEIPSLTSSKFIG